MFMLLLGSVKEPPPPLLRGMEADRTGVANREPREPARPKPAPHGPP